MIYLNKKTFENKDFFLAVEESLEKGDNVSFLVKGTSMLPIFKDSLTEVFITKKDKYQRFDVCLFKIDEQYILHRLVKTNKHHYYFRGDHSYNFEVVHKEDILAYVYKFKTGESIIEIDNFKYQFRFRFHLFIKGIKMFLRKILKGTKSGK